MLIAKHAHYTVSIPLLQHANMETKALRVTITSAFFVYVVALGHVRHHRATVGSHLTPRATELSGVGPQNTSFSPAPRSVQPHRDVCSDISFCVPPVQCPAHVRDDSKKYCSVIGGRRGICCTSGQNHTGKEFKNILASYCSSRFCCSFSSTI